MRSRINEGTPAIGTDQIPCRPLLILEILEFVASGFHSGDAQPSLLPVKTELRPCRSQNHRNQKRCAPDADSRGLRACRSQMASGHNRAYENEELNQGYDLKQYKKPIVCMARTRGDPQDSKEEYRQKNCAHVG